MPQETNEVIAEIISHLSRRLDEDLNPVFSPTTGYSHLCMICNWSLNVGGGGSRDMSLECSCGAQFHIAISDDEGCDLRELGSAIQSSSGIKQQIEMLKDCIGATPTLIDVDGNFVDKSNEASVAFKNEASVAFKNIDENVALQVFEEDGGYIAGSIDYKTMPVDDVAKLLIGYEKIVVNVYNHFTGNHKDDKEISDSGFDADSFMTYRIAYDEVNKILYSEGSHMKKLNLLTIKSYCSCDYSFSTDIKCKDDIDLLDDEKLKCLMDSILGANLHNKRFMEIVEKVCENSSEAKQAAGKDDINNNPIASLEF